MRVSACLLDVVKHVRLFWRSACLFSNWAGSLFSLRTALFEAITGFSSENSKPIGHGQNSC